MLGLAHPIKGSSRPMTKWVAPSKKRSRLMFLDTVAIKRHVYNTLKISDPDIAGFQWFPSNTEAYFFDQLMSEHLVKTENTWKFRPIKLGMRNEIIDLYCYATAAEVLFKAKTSELEDMVAWYATHAPAGAPEMPPHATLDPGGDDDTPEPPPAPPVPTTEPPRPGRVHTPRPARPARIRGPMIGW